MDRVDSRVKVTGGAKYAAEFNLPQIAFGVLVTSTIAKGKIDNIITKAAENAPGVLAVITHLNAKDIPGYMKPDDVGESKQGANEFRLFHNDMIFFNNQPVALAVADTLQRAQHAASLIKVSYKKSQHSTDLNENTGKAVTPQRSSDYTRGSLKSWGNPVVSIEEQYTTPIQVHNPMEPHAATAYWKNDEQLVIFNKSQNVISIKHTVMGIFNLKPENVQVSSQFVGGAFGSCSRLWPQEMAAILAARKIQRPVKVTLQRNQVFNMVGYRPQSVQHIRLGATKEGTLTGITHEAFGMTASYEQFTERIIDPTKTLYKCPNLNTIYKLVPLDVSPPCWTRGPGETSGSFALESAMDELAYKLNTDPIELRLTNYAEKDDEKNLPWSSNHLKECYQLGARRFGWDKRNPEPISMNEGEMLVGMGMSAGIYKSERLTANASAALVADGSFLIQTSVADVGPGSATVFTQIAADALGITPKNVQFKWGNSLFPAAPGQSGSHTTVSVGSAVHEVCNALKQKLTEAVTALKGPALLQARPEDLVIEEGFFKLRNTASKLSFREFLKQANIQEVKVTIESNKTAESEKYSGKSFCANFVKVLVHPLTGVTKVDKVVSVIDAGRIMNHKTARSQVYGAVVWGIGIALMEEGVIDDRYGRYVNNNLADYHLPVHADIPDIDVQFIDKPDTLIDPMGAKGLGEIGLIGFSAAVANAVYHATGKRVRDLPITPDKLI